MKREVPQKLMDMVMNLIRGREPDESYCSLHMAEDVFRFNGRALHVFWAIGDVTPMTAEIHYD